MGTFGGVGGLAIENCQELWGTKGIFGEPINRRLPENELRLVVNMFVECLHLFLQEDCLVDSYFSEGF